VRYKCLFVDHDDTAVDSTSTVHYPAHIAAMKRLRPDRRPVSLEGWFLKNFDPGIMEYLRGELRLSEAELAEETRIWRQHTRSGNPPFFPGFVEALREFRRRGGRIVVISHSEEDTVLRHYRRTGFAPDLVFGWTDDEARRKPSPWPVRTALRRFGLSPEDALVVDDLRPGVLMARRAGVASVAAGWCHSIPPIARFMEEHCLRLLRTVDELERFLLDGGSGGFG